LRTCTKEKLSVLGECNATVKQIKQLTVTVVDGDGPCLLGRDWLGHIRLNWTQISSIMVANYTDYTGFINASPVFSGLFPYYCLHRKHSINKYTHTTVWLAHNVSSVRMTLSYIILHTLTCWSDYTRSRLSSCCRLHSYS
jgi:hypothetical protein